MTALINLTPDVHFGTRLVCSNGLPTKRKNEYFFTFVGGGWNSVFAFNIRSARKLAKKEHEPYRMIDFKNFKKLDKSTQAQYDNLMSLFY